MIDLQFKRMGNHDLRVPNFASVGAAAIDLQAASEGCIQPGDSKIIGTGFAVAIPTGYVGMVCSRSGLAANRAVVVLNAPGLVDSDYRGEVGVILHNFGKDIFCWNIGDRIAQMMFAKIEDNFAPVSVIKLDETDRGEGGFGSTGV